MQSLSFFFRLTAWFSLRQLRMHPWRVMTVLLGIGLGAAVFTSVRLAVDASLDSFTRSMDLLSSKADWVVTRPGGRVPETLVVKLRNDPGVETASPMLSSYVDVSGEDEAPFLLIGLDPISDRPLRSWRATRSRESGFSVLEKLITTPYTLLLSQRLAERLGLEPGNTVKLEHVRQIAPFKILHTLEPSGLALVDGGYMAITDMATMQEFTGAQGWVDRIDLKLKPQADPSDVDRIRSMLPPGLALDPPGETKKTGNTLIRAYQLNLSVLSFVSLFVGMFLVYSLVSLNAASRRREVAILRSLGASSRLVFSLFISEGMILGILGWLVALPIGSLLVRYLVQGVSSTINDLFVRVRVDGIKLDTWEILLSLGVTLFVSSLAAYGAAQEVRRIAPREAMLIHGSPHSSSFSNRTWTCAGLLLIAITWPLSKLPGLPGLPLAGYLAVFVLFAGFSLLSPWILQLMGTHLSPLLRRLGGEPGFLGGRYVRDAGKRAAVSVGALITAMALFVALVITIHSFRYTVELWVNQTLGGDLFLRAKMAGLNQYRDSLPEEVVRGLQKLSGNAKVLPYRRIPLRMGDIPYQLEATDFELLSQDWGLIMMEGDLEKLMPKMVAGSGVIVSEVFANQTGLGIGERYHVRLGNADLDLPILGMCRDYRTQGGVVYMALKPFQSLTGDHEWSGARFFFTNRHQDLAAAADRLKADIIRCCAKRHPLEIASGLELRREVLRIFDETFAITSVLLLIALLVAGLGVTSTLTVLVLERVRELNTLSAVGASSRQIRSMIFWEAVLMVSAGESIGLVCGLFLSHLLIFVINRQSFGWTFLYRIDWGSLLVSLPLILGAALVAALPAIRLALNSSPALVLKEH
jgi:putative ABC transport system permease protein